MDTKKESVQKQSYGWKTITRQNEKTENNIGRVHQQEIFLVDNYGLRRAERWEETPNMSSEVGEI